MKIGCFSLGKRNKCLPHKKTVAGEQGAGPFSLLFPYSSGYP